jgi:hypothetical protein
MHNIFMPLTIVAIGLGCQQPGFCDWSSIWGGKPANN